MSQLAILNQKGGVGKTTTAVNLSAALADLGRRVLLIDLDPQAHATLHLGHTPTDDGPSVYDVLCREAKLEEAIRPLAGGLHLVPSSIDLAEVLDKDGWPTLSFDIVNLNNDSRKGYFQFGNAPFTQYSPGRTYSLGLRAKF